MFDRMPHHVKRMLRIVAGFVLLLLGAICGFIPVLQGWIFALAGLAILSVDFAWARRLREKLKDKARRAVDRFRRKSASETDCQ